MDVLTDEATLVRCREFLRGLPAAELEFALGNFGPFDVTLCAYAPHTTVSIFVDGPDFGTEFQGNQSAGLYVPAGEFLALLEERLNSLERGESTSW